MNQNNKSRYLNLKMVMRNLVAMSELKGHHFYNKQFIRHIYLAHSWIKYGSLLKAENPKESRQSVRINLLLSILKELKYDNNITYTDLKTKLDQDGFKIIERNNSLIPYEKYDSRTISSFLYPQFKIFLNPLDNKTSLHLFSKPKFWYVLKSLYNFSYPITQIEVTQMSVLFKFVSPKGASLVLKMPANFTELSWTQFICSYTFIIPNKITSHGDYKLDLKSWNMFPDILETFCHQVTSFEKYYKES